MIGYFIDVAEADNYFLTERLETEAWDLLDNYGSADAYKTKALNHAFNRIYYSQDFDLPLPSAATATQLIILKKAQAEMAYYIAAHVFGGDEDARKGLQAQGVVKAGVVQEDYEKEMLLATPIPAPVQDLLAGFVDNRRVFGFNLGRNENLNVNDKIKEYD